MTGIYCITNQINGKKYIGQSVNIQERWKAHRTKPFIPSSSQYDTPLYRAIRKYGLKNFTFSILEECSKEVLNERECFWIKNFDSYNNGYNATPGGDSNRIYSKLTELEVKEIQQLLLYSNLTEEAISKKFNVSQRTISSINLGQTWKEDCLSYPLVKNRNSNKKEYFCADCGAPVSRANVKCVNCARIIRRKSIRPSREELKLLIRKESFLSIGAKYGVSDNAIRKWCKAENLPFRKDDIKKYSDEEWELI